MHRLGASSQCQADVTIHFTKGETEGRKTPSVISEAIFVQILAS